MSAKNYIEVSFRTTVDSGELLSMLRDGEALGCARELSAANAFGPEFQLRIASFENIEPDAFDVVLANLDGKTLPQLCKFLPRFLSADGAACLSGLQQQDYEEIADAAGRANLRVTARMEREDWVALEVRRI